MPSLYFGNISFLNENKNISVDNYCDKNQINSSQKMVNNIQSTFSKKERKMMGLDSNEDVDESILARFVTRSDDEPVSYFELSDVGKHINASVGTKNGDKYRGKGYGSACIEKGLEWYKKNAYKFKNKPIVWWAEKDNIASQKIAEKNGFKKDSSIERSDDKWLKENWFKYVYKV